jgi:TRAP-type mannitol/chloroaromatic compound transport system substrate-binding protein
MPAANWCLPLAALKRCPKARWKPASGAAYYWAGKEPACQWFAAVPFGMNAQGMASWFWGGNGLKLWEEVYADFNLVPRPAGNTGVQMGGWFNKKINTIDDYKGLKMRIPGLGGKVVAKAGGTVVLTAGRRDLHQPGARRDRRHRVGGPAATT